MTVLYIKDPLQELFHSHKNSIKWKYFSRSYISISLGHSLKEENQSTMVILWLYCYWIFTQIGLSSEKAMAPYSSTLTWKIPWTEEPGRLQTMGSRKVGHDWATSLSLSCIGEGNGNPLQCSCLENPRDGGAWWAAVYGVTQSRTWLKRLSSSRGILWLKTPWGKF